MTPKTRATTTRFERKLGIALALVLGAAAALSAGWAVWAGVTDRAEATRELAAARTELAEIAGRDLLAREAPPLPPVAAFTASVEEKERVGRLVAASSEAWTEADRAWIRALADREEASLAALGQRGKVLDQQELLDRLLPILFVQKLLTLADREALLTGDELTFLDGFETRLDLARRLTFQPGLIGAVTGASLRMGLLADVRLAVGRPETSAATLTRLETLLLQLGGELPDPAALLAQDTLAMIALREAPHNADHSDSSALFMAPWARAFAQLARDCRSGRCQEAIDRISDPAAREDGPHQAVAKIMIPETLAIVRKLDATRELSGVALLALGLRLHAVEHGDYPDELASLAAMSGLDEAALAVLAREPAPAGGVRLRFSPPSFENTWYHRSRELAAPLLVWELPAARRPENAT